MQAADQALQTAECTVRINVTDKNRHPPQFDEEEYTFSVSEAAGSGTSVGSVKVHTYTSHYV